MCLKNEIKKRFVIILFLFISLMSIISAADVCCEKTKNDSWCQIVPEEECAIGSRKLPTFCEETPFCKLGTCIDTQTGKCISQTNKKECEENSNGKWYNADIDDIDECKKGCCFLGNSPKFTTKRGCEKIGEDYRIETIFRSEITNEYLCISLQTGIKKGACVSKEKNNDGKRGCFISEEKSCNRLENFFYAGVLCTAENLETECIKTEKTKCYEEKIYFLDSCGNLANIYDSSKYEDENYWTYIKSAEESCVVTSTDEKCGNCEYDSGTICSEYEKGKEDMPLKSPLYGDYVCSSMSCYYDTNHDGRNEKYEHGESWCAETPGTYPHIPFSLVYDDKNSNLTQLEKNVILAVRDKLKDNLKYNLPGSEYARLVCWEGKIKKFDCMDKRREICAESDIDGFSYAFCVLNDFETCETITNQFECEDPKKMCRWVWGYRFDRKNLNKKAHNLDKDWKKNYNFQEQGSCVPLIPPGTEFWDAESRGQSRCTLDGSIIETVLYETHWTESRDDLTRSFKFRANNCYANCYAIPKYGREYETDRKLDSLAYFHGGGDLGDDPSDQHLSERRGYYCKGATGEVKGEQFNCVWWRKDKKKDKTQIPIFYTNKQWIEQLTERTDAVGDCGYKLNFVQQKGDNASEMITAQFQKLTRKGKVSYTGKKKLIYLGDDWISVSLKEYENDMHSIVREGEPPNMSAYTYTDENGNIWYNEEENSEDYESDGEYDEFG